MGFGFQWMILALSVQFLIVAGEYFKPFNVSYDHRALIIGGKRRMLISAGIHYPRATPEMWPDLISKTKNGGADVVETYVFWNGHEPVKGQYYFEGRYDIVKFVKQVGSSGLYLFLRIGPYVCAEWNFGGFPVWLRDIPGIEFRTDNVLFKRTRQLEAESTKHSEGWKRRRGFWSKSISKIQNRSCHDQREVNVLSHTTS